MQLWQNCLLQKNDASTFWKAQTDAGKHQRVQCTKEQRYCFWCGCDAEKHPKLRQDIAKQHRKPLNLTGERFSKVEMQYLFAFVFHHKP